jgi:hypothetical protein
MGFTIALGTTVRDRVTFVEGVVTGRSDYLTGCNLYLVQPRGAPDGSVKDSHWFDEQRLEVVADAPRLTLDNSAAKGADRAAPKK